MIRSVSRRPWPGWALVGLLLLVACAPGQGREPAPQATASGDRAGAPAGETGAESPTQPATRPSATPRTPPPEPTAGATQLSTIPTVPVATATPVPADATVAPGPPETLVVTAADGLRLVGTFYPGAGAGPRPAVLLLHMLGSNREAWAPLAPELADVGYSVLALDMRGHGETGGAPDWTLAGDDLTRVWQVLSGRPDVDAGRTAIIGASIGANLALVVAAEIPAVRTVVLLSPGLDYRGVQTEAAMTAYGDRPVLIVASAEDGYAADSSRRLAGLAPGAALTIYEGAGHGTVMLAREPGPTDLILDWLRRHSR